MAKVKRIKGLDKLIKQIEHKSKKTKGLFIGVRRAGLFLQRESQKIVPIDTGTLRNSANTRAVPTEAGLEVIVSYGTEYAVFVHENLEAHHPPLNSKKKPRPGAAKRRAKFLEEPARTKRKDMKRIIKQAMLKELGP